ncbi:MAG: HAMP domain-containing histidine kinase [Elusimicrobia bacterium]|nr:HAMP domain-containing histidine kinase [Elusimicrobiota bacterium]
MITFAKDDNTRETLRLNVLAVACLGVIASVMLWAGVLPFPKTVTWFTGVSAASYTLYFIFFDRICRTCYRTAGILLSQLGVLIITVSIYFTGGVVSPLVFLYMAMLVSESIYGLENNYTVPVSASGYLVVVGAQYWGWLPNPAPWAAGAYSSPVFVCVVVMLVVAYLVLTKNMSEKIVNGLRARLELEAIERTAMMKKFSELDSTAQIGALAHRIAHDLRAPLASISGYIQLELLKPRDTATKQVFTDLNDIVDGMTESLSCITRFGKVSQAHEEELDLVEFFRQLLAIAAFSPQALGVKFVKDCPEKTALRVLASRSDLQQAFFNIVKNAVEAMADNASGKRLEVALKRDGKEAEITISDNGPGIPPAALKDLFRKSITTKKDGTGVGLIITRDLLTRNNGSLEFHNRKEGGLRVVTRLPLVG